MRYPEMTKNSVDSDESAGDRSRPQVIGDDGRHRDGPERLDLGSRPFGSPPPRLESRRHPG
jgi:hypothetical protein